MTTPTGRTGSSAQVSSSPRPARRLRRATALAAAGTVALATAGLAASGISSASPARTRPSTSVVYVGATAPVPGTHVDFAIGRNAAGKETVWRYSGSSWKTVKTGLTSSEYLTGVAATSSSHVWLVGQSDGNDTTTGLLLAWNGSSFKVQKSGTIKNATFGGITGGSSSAWLWGTQVVNDSTSTLLEHWTGHAWAKASTAGIAEGTEIVSMATSGSSAWILASSSLGGGSSYKLLHWTGSGWKTTSYPGHTNDFLVLNTIAAGTSSTAFAAGYISSGNTATGIALRWNGSKWSSYNMEKNMYPFAVGATGSHAWVGGYRTTGTLTGAATIERWTGHSFSPVSIAGTGQKFSEIASIAVNSATDAIAVGTSGANGCDETGQIFERLSGSHWSKGGTIPQFATAGGFRPDC